MFKRMAILQEQASDPAASGGDAPASAVTPVPAPAPSVILENVDTPAAILPDPALEPIKSIWPDDWRKNIAGTDEKELKRLGRFATPADLHKAYRSLETKLSSGELKPTLPKDAKPEELAQWRKDNGIPETSDKYDFKLDNNLVVGETDKPIVDGILEAAHAANFTPDQAKAAVQFYFKNRVMVAEQRAEKDETDRQSALDNLNKEWGGNFRQNLNMVGSLLTHFPASVQDAIKSARLPDGTALFNNPDVVRGFTAMALEINPAGTIVPAGGGDVAKSVDDEIATIEKTMRENRKEYTKNESLQARYRELLTTREKLRERKAA